MRKPKKWLVLASALAMVLLFSVPGMAVIPEPKEALPNCEDLTIPTLSSLIEERVEECIQDGQVCQAITGGFGGIPEIVCPPDEGNGGGGGDGGGGGGGGGGGAAAAPLELSQETEQEAESGDVDQSFDVSSTGDNSNQCAGVQGVSNTGNAQNVTDLLQAASETDDFEFEEVGSTIDVSPTNTTDCTGEVNQAASASG